MNNKELAEDLESVLYDLTNGEIYEAMKYLGDIITHLKRSEDVRVEVAYKTAVNKLKRSIK